MSSIGLEIRPQGALTAFKALLPCAKYFAEWFKRVWQPDADNNGGFAGFFKFEVRQTAIIVCSGLPNLTQQVQIFFF